MNYANLYPIVIVGELRIDPILLLACRFQTIYKTLLSISQNIQKGPFHILIQM